MKEDKTLRGLMIHTIMDYSRNNDIPTRWRSLQQELEELSDSELISALCSVIEINSENYLKDKLMWMEYNHEA